MQPTAEQEDAIGKFATGKKLRMSAYAGCGKTTSLRLLAESAGRRAGTLMCFNKSIADDAASRFPNNVTCSTTHSLAYRAIVKQGFSPPKMTGNVNGGFLAGKLGLQEHVIGGLRLRPRGWGFLIAETIKRWQRTGRDEISPGHVPLEGKLADLKPEHKSQLTSEVTAEARRLWQRMSNPNDEMPLGHDGYLKLWAMQRPTIPGEFVMLDEAQDTNGVVLELMRHQSAQLIAVGDKFQQIYEWRGALTPYVVGGVGQLLEFVSATEKLMAGQSVEYPLEFFGFKDWAEVKATVNYDEGAELSQWVNLVEKYGTAQLRAALERLPKTEKSAQLILSTGHKSKGREWDKVRLCDDFLLGVRAKDKDGKAMQPDPAMHAAELRLLYVAATRGKQQLEMPLTLTEKLIQMGADKGKLAASMMTPPPPASGERVGVRVETSATPPTSTPPSTPPSGGEEQKLPDARGKPAARAKRKQIKPCEMQIIIGLLRAEANALRGSDDSGRRAMVCGLLAKLEGQESGAETHA